MQKAQVPEDEVDCSTCPRVWMDARRRDVHVLFYEWKAVSIAAVENVSELFKVSVMEENRFA